MLGNNYDGFNELLNEFQINRGNTRKKIIELHRVDIEELKKFFSEAEILPVAEIAFLLQHPKITLSASDHTKIFYDSNTKEFVFEPMIYLLNRTCDITEQFKELIKQNPFFKSADLALQYDGSTICVKKEYIEKFSDMLDAYLGIDALVEAVKAPIINKLKNKYSDIVNFDNFKIYPDVGSSEKYPTIVKFVLPGALNDNDNDVTKKEAAYINALKFIKVLFNYDIRSTKDKLYKKLQFDDKGKPMIVLTLEQCIELCHELSLPTIKIEPLPQENKIEDKTDEKAPDIISVLKMAHPAIDFNCAKLYKSPALNKKNKNIIKFVIPGHDKNAGEFIEVLFLEYKINNIKGDKKTLQHEPVTRHPMVILTQDELTQLCNKLGCKVPEMEFIPLEYKGNSKANKALHSLNKKKNPFFNLGSSSAAVAHSQLISHKKGVHPIVNSPSLVSLNSSFTAQLDESTLSKKTINFVSVFFSKLLSEYPAPCSRGNSLYYDSNSKDVKITFLNCNELMVIKCFDRIVEYTTSNALSKSYPSITLEKIIGKEGFIISMTAKQFTNFCNTELNLVPSFEILHNLGKDETRLSI